MRPASSAGADRKGEWEVRIELMWVQPASTAIFLCSDTCTA